MGDQYFSCLVEALPVWMGLVQTQVGLFMTRLRPGSDGAFPVWIGFFPTQVKLFPTQMGHFPTPVRLFMTMLVLKRPFLRPPKAFC